MKGLTKEHISWTIKFWPNRIILISYLFFMNSCTQQVSEKNWPTGINLGDFRTTEKVFVYTEEKRNLYGADIILTKRYPIGGRAHGEIKDIPIGSKITVEKFEGITGYGVKSWYVFGLVETETKKLERFLYQSAFGYQMPTEISVPWN